MRNDFVYLVQTDTTVGFLSADASRLSVLKGRPDHKPFLRVVDSLSTLKTLVRPPRSSHRLIRYAQKHTFIYPYVGAIRVVATGEHHEFLTNFGHLYSTSANPSGGDFDHSFAVEQADVIVETPQGLSPTTSSALIKLGKGRHRRLR